MRCMTPPPACQKLDSCITQSRHRTAPPWDFHEVVAVWQHFGTSGRHFDVLGRHFHEVVAFWQHFAVSLTFSGVISTRQASKCFVLQYFCSKSNPSSFKMPCFTIRVNSSCGRLPSSDVTYIYKCVFILRWIDISSCILSVHSPCGKLQSNPPVQSGHHHPQPFYIVIPEFRMYCC